MHLIHSAALAASLFATSAYAISIGQVAPDFTLTDVTGKAVKLSEFKGKTVVLEWLNPNCPFVRKHYDSANMQGLQKEAGGQQVVWLAVNSTSTTHQDYLDPAQLGGWMSKSGAATKATLMDADGKIGRVYDAKTTPHMYIIDPAGKLVYNGAIDDKRSANPADIKTSKNYVRVALGESLGGKAVSQATTTPYGCSVKY